MLRLLRSLSQIWSGKARAVPLHEQTARQRARVDTDEFGRNRPLWFSVFVAPLAGAVGVTATLVVDAVGAEWPAWAKILGGAIGALVGVILAIALLWTFFWLRAPRAQRDDARATIAELQATTEFPDVAFRASAPLVHETRDSLTFPGERETLLSVKVSVTNRETTQPAILRFTAFAIRPPLRPFLQQGIERLRRVHNREWSDAFIPDPLRLEPRAFVEGEVCFMWDHSMDFQWGSDLPEDEVISRFMSTLHLNVKDELCDVKIEIPLPEGEWYRV